MKKKGLVLGLAIFVLVALLPVQSMPPKAMKVLALAVLMLIWWVTEAIPIAVTALLPLLLLPLMQVYDMKTAATHYSSPIIFLFMGGFMLALAIEKWNLHRRIALHIVKLTGVNADGIILGFMLSTAFLSMWISNTATAVMMLPIAISVINLLEKTPSLEAEKQKKFALTLMLGIAYSANIGGTATLIGTPPNVVLAGFINEVYHIEVSFIAWFAFGFPFAAILLVASFLVLTKIIFPNKIGKFENAKSIIEAQIQDLGSVSEAEKKTFAVFLLTAFLWIFRGQINNGLGLSSIVLSDEMIAIFATVLLFIIPVRSEKSDAILSWQDSSKLPWGILLLFGGGLSLASALEHVGWIGTLSNLFNKLETNSLLITLGLTSISLFLTEIMSNVALVTVFLPVVGAIAVGLGLNPILFCVPITLASSCAFMLPMGTPPNAIVFASGYLKVADMVKAGIWINMIAIVLIMILGQWILPLLF